MISGIHRLLGTIKVSPPFTGLSPWHCSWRGCRRSRPCTAWGPSPSIQRPGSTISPCGRCREGSLKKRFKFFKDYYHHNPNSHSSGCYGLWLVWSDWAIWTILADEFLLQNFLGYFESHHSEVKSTWHVYKLTTGQLAKNSFTEKNETFRGLWLWKKTKGKAEILCDCVWREGLM